MRWRVPSTTPTLHSQRAKPSPSWSRLCPGIRSGSGLARIPRVLCGKARAAPALRVPAPHGASWRHTGGGGSGGSDPPFLTAGAPPGRGKWSTLRSTTYPSPSGGRSLHSDPCGKASGRPFALTEDECLLRVALCGFVTCLLRYVLWRILCCTVFHFISASLRKPVNVSSSSAPSGTSTSGPGCAPSSMRPSKNSRPQMAQRPRRASLEDAHDPISPIRSTGSLPPRSTVPEEESPGSNDRKHVRQ